MSFRRNEGFLMFFMCSGQTTTFVCSFVKSAMKYQNHICRERRINKIDYTEGRWCFQQIVKLQALWVVFVLFTYNAKWKFWKIDAIWLSNNRKWFAQFLVICQHVTLSKIVKRFAVPRTLRQVGFLLLSCWFAMVNVFST